VTAKPDGPDLDPFPASEAAGEVEDGRASLRPLLALKPYVLRYRGMIAEALAALIVSAAAELALRWREVPRTRIPAGSVAIAMSMSCIFPRETPCGLHLIGRSPVALWRQSTGADFGALLAPGDRVIFAPISLREYEDLHAEAAAGKLVITPVDETRDAAA
jgi:hypothetical protein